MSIRASKCVVRLAAVVTGLTSIYVLYLSGSLAYRTITSNGDAPDFWRTLGLAGLFAVLPVMFVWAAVCAWRYAPKGIISLSSGWMLFGIAGAVFHFFWFYEDGKIRDAMYGAIWLSIFLGGLLIGKQEPRLRNNPAS